MKLGWIDFSKNDKSKALQLIASLGEKGVLDELGFGILRDAFANDFFPGISTLQTRAKYFLTVPYMLHDIQMKCLNGEFKNTGNPDTFFLQMRDEIAFIETAYKDVLVKTNPGEEGIVGSTAGDGKGVERTPLIIYWSGLRTFNIIGKKFENYTYSRLQADFYNLALRAKKKELDGENTEIVLPIPEYFDNDKWNKNSEIKLTKEEAKFLKEKICTSEKSKNSLLAQILKNDEIKTEYLNIRNNDNKQIIINGVEQKSNNSFENTATILCRYVNEEKSKKLKLAVYLNDFYELVMLRYVYILVKNKPEEDNLDIENRWKDIEPKIKKICDNFDIDEIYKTVAISNNLDLEKFLKKIKAALLESVQKSGPEKYKTVDEIISIRESNIKRDRAKTTGKRKYNVKDLFLYKKFDYRLDTVYNLVKDIRLENEGGKSDA